jgi:hypothetical protein
MMALKTETAGTEDDVSKTRILKNDISYFNISYQILFTL